MRKKQIIAVGIILGLSLIGLIFTQAAYFRTAFQLKKAQFDYMVNQSLNEVVAYLEEQYKQGGSSVADSLFSEMELNGVGDIPVYIDMKQGAPLKNDINRLMHNTLSLVDDDADVQDVNDILGPKHNCSLQNSLQKYRQEVKKRLGTEYDVVLKINAAQPEQELSERIKDIDLNMIIADRLKNNGILENFEFAVKENGRFILQSQNFFNKHSDYSYNRRMFFGSDKSRANLFLIFPDRVEASMSSVFLLVPSMIITLLLVLCFAFCIAVIIRQKKLSTIKNDFINNMTHEFKTPIATISLAAQMLKDDAVNNSPESVNRFAGIIKDESKRLTFQVEKVLQTALFTETRMKLKVKNVHVNEIVENQLAKFNLRVEDRKGQLFCHLNADRDEVLADEVHITNVISNLLDNAIKYCAKTPEISVYTRNKGDEIIISVIDNGIGIASKEQKLIFERFYRVSTGNLHDVKGFGLGLSYVKKIIEAHGGRIEVESALDKGSRFDIILPLISKKQKVKRTLFF